MITMFTSRASRDKYLETTTCYPIFAHFCTLKINYRFQNSCPTIPKKMPDNSKKGFWKCHKKMPYSMYNHLSGMNFGISGKIPGIMLFLRLSGTLFWIIMHFFWILCQLVLDLTLIFWSLLHNCLKNKYVLEKRFWDVVYKSGAPSLSCQGFILLGLKQLPPFRPDTLIVPAPLTHRSLTVVVLWCTLHNTCEASHLPPPWSSLSKPVSGFVEAAPRGISWLKRVTGPGTTVTDTLGSLLQKC